MKELKEQGYCILFSVSVKEVENGYQMLAFLDREVARSLDKLCNSEESERERFTRICNLLAPIFVEILHETAATVSRMNLKEETDISGDAAKIH